MTCHSGLLFGVTMYCRLLLTHTDTQYTATHNRTVTVPSCVRESSLA